MDNDKFEKAIDIILQNQAQFYAELQKTQENHTELQEIQKKSEGRISELEKTMHSLVRVTLKTSETVEKLGEKVDKLADAQKETDERLNAVIYMAEKYFSRNNGDSDKK